MGTDARTADAKGREIQKMPLAPMKKEDAPNADPEQAWECPTFTMPQNTLTKPLGFCTIL